MANKPLRSIKFPGLPDTYTIDSGLSETAKAALLACFRHVAWTDEHGQDYYDALERALSSGTYPKIIANFNPGANVIYTADSLDTLKQYLTVKYYANSSDTGTVVPSNNYTLLGTLVAGTSTIIAKYNDLTSSFTINDVVDFYNIYEWDFATGDSSLGMTKDEGASTSIDLGEGTTYRFIPQLLTDSSSKSKRTAFHVSKGKEGAEVMADRGVLLSPARFLIPIPEDAIKVTGTITPSTQYFSVREWVYEGNGNWTRRWETGWKQGTATYTFTGSGANRYITINCKPASNGDTPYGSSYPRPENIHISFLTE